MQPDYTRGRTHNRNHTSSLVKAGRKDMIWFRAAFLPDEVDAPGIFIASERMRHRPGRATPHSFKCITVATFRIHEDVAAGAQRDHREWFYVQHVSVK